MAGCRKEGTAERRSLLLSVCGQHPQSAGLLLPGLDDDSKSIMIVLVLQGKKGF